MGRHKAQPLQEDYQSSLKECCELFDHVLAPGYTMLFVTNALIDRSEETNSDKYACPQT